MMVNAVSRYHQTYDLLEMLTLLNHWTGNLHKKNGQSNVMVPYVTHTLRHKVRFGKSSHAMLSTTHDEVVGEGCTPSPHRFQDTRRNFKDLSCCVFRLYSLFPIF